MQTKRCIIRTINRALDISTVKTLMLESDRLAEHSLAWDGSDADGIIFDVLKGVDEKIFELSGIGDLELMNEHNINKRIRYLGCYRCMDHVNEILHAMRWVDKHKDGEIGSLLLEYTETFNGNRSLLAGHIERDWLSNPTKLKDFTGRLMSAIIKHESNKKETEQEGYTWE